MKTNFISIGDTHSTSTLLEALKNTVWMNEERYYVADRMSNLMFTEKLPEDLVINQITHSFLLNVGNTLTKTPFGNFLNIHRNNKIVQNWFLTNFIEKFTNKTDSSMKVPLTWDDWKEYETRKEMIVLRPAHGARSIGLAVINPEVTTIDSVIKTVNDFLVETSPESTVVGSLEICHFNTQLSERIKNLPGNPVWNSANDRYVGEGAKFFLEQPMVQEYIPNISKEYRVIIGGDNRPAYCIERERNIYDVLNNVPLAYASGANVGVKNSYSSMSESGIPKRVEEEFFKLLEIFDFSMFSFDLFTTDDGKWGIFEFSPEFGTCSVPNGFSVRESRKFIERLIRDNKLTSMKK